MAEKLTKRAPLTIGQTGKTAEGVEVVVVPREPTEAMIEAGLDYDEKHDQIRLGRPLTVEECQAGQWRAMVSIEALKGE